MVRGASIPDDKSIIFSYFSKETGFDLSNPVLRGKNISVCRLLKILPNMLSFKISEYLG